MADNDSTTQFKSSILDEAKKAVVGAHDAYGHPRENFRRIAAMWTVILGRDVTMEQVGLCMIALKMSRQMKASKRDNLVDIAGYAEAMELIHEEA